MQFTGITLDTSLKRDWYFSENEEPKTLFSVHNGLNRKNSSIEFNNLAKQSAVCTALNATLFI